MSISGAKGLRQDRGKKSKIMACRKDVLETAKVAGCLTTRDEKNTAKKKCIGDENSKENISEYSGEI